MQSFSPTHTPFLTMKLKLILLSTALFGTVALTGCETKSAEPMKGAVEAVDAAAKTITIAGTQYTAAETVTLDGIAMGDSVNYSVDGTTVTSLDRFYTAAPMDAPMTDSLGAGVDSLGNAIGTGLDSAAAAIQNAAAGAANAMDNATDSATVGQ